MHVLKCCSCQGELSETETTGIANQVLIPKKTHYKFKRGGTHSELLETFHYNPKTGVFTRLKTASGKKCKVGMIAGGIKKTGYVVIRFAGGIYSAHRMAWFYHYGAWPDGEIDHINGVKSDNRIENLRLASRADNIRNIGIRKRNQSGFKGVSKAGNRWQARINFNNQKIYIGLFLTQEEAHDAYCKEAIRLHGDFANIDNSPHYLNMGESNE